LGFLRDAAKSSEPDSLGDALGALNSLDTSIEALRARGGLEGAEREAAGFVLAIAEEARQRVRRPEDVHSWEPPHQLKQADAELLQQRDAERKEFQRLLAAPCRTIRQLGEWSREAFAWLAWHHDHGPYWHAGESRDLQYFQPIASKAWVEATRLTTREVSEMLDASTQPYGVFRCVEALQRLRDLAESCEGNGGRDEDEKRRGHPKLTAGQLAKYREIKERWEKAKSAGVRKPQFCEDNHITLERLETALRTCRKKK
jgi:hypothetical protein